MGYAKLPEFFIVDGAKIYFRMYSKLNIHSDCQPGFRSEDR